MPACQKEYTGTVIDNNCITTATPLPGGSTGVAYTETLEAPALTAPLTWEVLNGTLPDGLDIGESTGEIFGVPTFVGLFSFQAKVTDVDGLYCLKNFTVNISGGAANCGWWTDFPFVPTHSPFCAPVWTPVDLVGASLINFSVGPTIVDQGCYLYIDGFKTYTGPPVALKVKVVVTALGFNEFGTGNVDVYISDGITDFINESITALGTYYFTCIIPESAAVEYEVFLAGVNGAVATMTLSCIDIALTTTGGFYLSSGIPPMGEFFAVPGQINPQCTLTLVSPQAISVDMYVVVDQLGIITNFGLTVDGVTMAWDPPIGVSSNTHVGLPTPMTINLDACVPVVIQAFMTGLIVDQNNFQIYFVPTPV